MTKILYAVLIYIYCTTTIMASTPSQTPNIKMSHHTLGKYLSIYEDKSATMTLEDIIKLPQSAFKELNKPISSHGFTQSAIWYRLNVINNKNTALSRVFVFEPSWLDHITITIFSPKGESKEYQGGNTFQYDKRSLNHYLINFRHTFEVGTSQVYIRVKTRDPFIVSIALMDELTFLSEQSFYSLLIGLFYGGMIALLIYNLLLYFNMKENYYLFYVFYLFSFLLVNASYNGYTYMLILSDYPSIQNWSSPILAYLFIFSALLFTNSFLDLKKNHPKLHALTKYLFFTIFVIALSSAFLGGYQYNVMFGVTSVMVSSVYIVSIAFYSLMKGNRSARLFLLGALSGLIGVFITALTLMSIIPYSYYTFKASDFGMYLDVILLSFALADHLKIIQEEKIKAELDANTDVLTGLLNKRALYEISESKSKILLRYYRDFSVIMIDIDNFKDINDTYGHLSGDMVLKEVAGCITKHIRESDDSFRIGGDEFIVFLDEAKETDAYPLAQRIQKDISNIQLKQISKDLAITCSIGISGFKLDDANIDAIVQRADEALYEVKHSGKNDIKTWSL